MKAGMFALLCLICLMAILYLMGAVTSIEEAVIVSAASILVALTAKSLR